MMLRTSRGWVLPLAIAVLSSANARAGGVRYVNAQLGTGANDGTSWSNAHQGSDGLRAALAAVQPGEALWVAGGTYLPTPTGLRGASFAIPSGLAIFGGFAGSETAAHLRDPIAHPVVLSGDLLGDDAQGGFADNSYHVIRLSGGGSAMRRLDGLVVAGGNADGAGMDGRGGGVLISDSSLVQFLKVEFRDNRSLLGGGALQCIDSSARVQFDYCRFTGNQGGLSGGALSALRSSAIVVRRSTFESNTAGRGGAIAIEEESTVSVVNCLLRLNRSTGAGGGGALWIGASPASRIANLTIVENASDAGPSGGIAVTGNSPAIANCIAWDNTGPGGGQASGDQIAPAGLAVTYSFVEGGYAGTGNRALDPLFRAPAAGDFELTLASPAIDAGNNAAIPQTDAYPDLLGAPRFLDEPATADSGAGSSPLIDVGAYEFPSPYSTATCFGDGRELLVQCPCGNDGVFLSGTGCMNSLGLGGLLASSGISRISSDTFRLLGSQMPGGTCLYFQSTEFATPTPFGDGLGCVGGVVTRLGTKQNSGGASQYPDALDAPISVRGVIPGSCSRYYQAWYRNSAPFCTASGFNVTNGMGVRWEP